MTLCFLLVRELNRFEIFFDSFDAQESLAETGVGWGSLRGDDVEFEIALVEKSELLLLRSARADSEGWRYQFSPAPGGEVAGEVDASRPVRVDWFGDQPR